MLLQMNKGLVATASIILANQLMAAPYYCGSNGGVYADQTFCNTACGGTCQSIQAAASGASGTCDTTNYDGFIYTGSKTFAISKTSNFWSGFANLAQPTSDSENTLLNGIVSNYGGSGWIGVYDPTLSNAFNTIDATNYIYADGTALLYSHWASGQPDNKNDNIDIGLVSINGEHWAYMQSSGGWADDGYHVSYGGDYKPKKKGLVEWNGPLDCVNGTPPNTMSGKTGYWCGDTSGNLAQCLTQDGYSVAVGATTTDYTSKVTTTSTTTYPATVTTVAMCRFIYNGDGDSFDAPCSIGNYCPSGGGWYYDSDNQIQCYSGDIWDGTHTVSGIGTTTTYSCLNGGVLSGTICTTTATVLACPTGYTATTGADTVNGQCKKSVNYTYYNYLCSTGTATNTGGNCTKTDPSGTTDNTATLSTACNSSTPPTNNCGSSCPLGSYQCVDVSLATNTDTAQGLNDKTDNGAKDSSGNCLGKIYIFNGNDQRCRTPGIQTGFSDCCQKGDKWFGLAQCSQSEQALGKLKEFGDLDGNCHYIGEYCSEKWPIIGCVQNKKTYCCFGSALSRIIQEGGRNQLGISWGSAESPQCRGFTPTEFQKIDFSKIDFSEWVKYDVIPNVQNNAVSNINNTVNNITNSFQ